MRFTSMATGLVLSILSCSAFAEDAVVKEGDTLAPITLQDQFDKPLVVDGETKVLLFSSDMDGGEVIQAAFDEVAESDRPANLAYVADISGMPSLIAKFVAIPKMKDYSFVLGLDKEGDVSALLPTKENQATIIKLDNLTIKSITYAEDAQSLMTLWK
ncbi:hypothetical protein [Shewanella gaetbuli]|uniref:Uncharacterized protein n=1 Tax=Shewanella gaetbuli TaxID=220752 RepID=A0A9X2CMJ0_9GAMM|nr:hypothetical protein [Shewanella gaetbuli]MCL1143735.1 hypothetical protein [Shewanella gaetbuli]